MATTEHSIPLYDDFLNDFEAEKGIIYEGLNYDDTTEESKSSPRSRALSANDTQLYCERDTEFFSSSLNSSFYCKVANNILNTLGLHQLLDCLSYIHDYKDLMNFSLTCKEFYVIYEYTFIPTKLQLTASSRVSSSSHGILALDFLPRIFNTQASVTMSSLKLSSSSSLAFLNPRGEKIIGLPTPIENLNNHMDNQSVAYTVIHSTEEFAQHWSEGRKRSKSLGESINKDISPDDQIISAIDEQQFTDIRGNSNKFNEEYLDSRSNSFANATKHISATSSQSPNVRIPSSSLLSSPSVNIGHQNINSCYFEEKSLHWAWNQGYISTMTNQSSSSSGLRSNSKNQKSWDSTSRSNSITTSTCFKTKRNNTDNCFKLEFESTFKHKLRYIQAAQEDKWDSLRCAWTWALGYIRSQMRVVWVDQFVNANKDDGIHREIISPTESSWINPNLNSSRKRKACPLRETLSLELVNSKTPFVVASHYAPYTSCMYDEALVLSKQISSHKIFHTALKKLVARDWRLTYDHINEEIKLQAQALGRDIYSCWHNNKLTPIRRHMKCSRESLSNYISQAETLVLACESYLHWCREVDEICWALNDKLCLDSDGYHYLSIHSWRKYGDEAQFGNALDSCKVHSPKLDRKIQRRYCNSHVKPYQYTRGDFTLDDNETLKYAREDVHSNYTSVESYMPCLSELGIHAVRNHVLLSPLLTEGIDACIHVIGWYIDSTMDQNTSNFESRYCEYSAAVSTLMQIYKLLEIVDIPDNLLVCCRKTRTVVWERYGVPLMKLSNLAPHVRDYKLKKLESYNLL